MLLPWIAAGGGLSAARAAPVTVEWSAATSFVPYLHAPGTAVDTLSGAWTTDGVFDPRLRFGLSARLVAELGDRDVLTAGWGVFRDQALCDTCAGGAGPGWLGSELLGSTDLIVRLAHEEPLQDGAALKGIADVVLPASRDALWCNPMVAAPGLGASFALPVGDSTVGLGVSGRRPFYLHRAAPIGLCSPELAGDSGVVALTGPVVPTPYDGSWFGAANPTFTGAATVGWTDPHFAFAGAPKRLHSELSTGMQLERRAADETVTVRALTGTVTVPAAYRPVRVLVPWAVSLGWDLTDATLIELSAGNRTPAVLADPGGTFRALPATTSFSAALRGRL